MLKPDILKFADTLSAKERMKFVISNWHKSVTDRPILSATEQKAVFDIKTSDDWFECHYLMSLYQWGNLILRDEIEKTAIRLSAIGLQMVHFRLFLILDDIIKSEIDDLNASLLRKFIVKNKSYNPGTNTETIAIKENSLLRPGLKELVAAYNDQLQQVSDLQETVRQIEAELDGTALFDEVTYTRIRGYDNLADKFTSAHNSYLEVIETKNSSRIKQLIDKEYYIIKRPNPNQQSVEELISGIKNLADTELSMWQK